MSAAGSIWQNTPDRSPLWWLAAEITAMANELPTPEDIDPRVWCVEQYPATHAHWVQRIVYYLPHL